MVEIGDLYIILSISSVFQCKDNALCTVRVAESPLQISESATIVGLIVSKLTTIVSVIVSKQASFAIPEINLMIYSPGSV